MVSKGRCVCPVLPPQSAGYFDTPIKIIENHVSYWYSSKVCRQQQGAYPTAGEKVIKGSFINTPRGFFHYHRLGQTGKQIHFCHGSSLSAGTYLPFLEDLAEEGFRVVASDLRGHGFSTKDQTAKIESWQIFIKDMAALVASITKPPVIGMGHSIGGYFTYAAAALYPHLFSRLVLIDPIIFPPMVVWAAALLRKTGLSGRLKLAQMARNKKAEFGSRQEALAHYKGKGMFASWQQASVEAFVATAVEQDTTDTYSLCCLPEFEAQIYEHVPFDTWSHAAKIKVPVMVVRGETSDLFFRGAGRRLEKKITDCRFVELDGMGHFMMMENPGRVVKTVRPFLASIAAD